MQQDADMSREVSLANLCHVLSCAFASPLEMRRELPDMLRTLSGALSVRLAPLAARAADSWAEALEDRDALSLAYARLFLGPFEILAPPYASFYLEPDQRIMGEVSNHVAQQYAEAQLKPSDGPREVPDHVALEWEFLHYLTHQHIVTGDAAWLQRRDSFVATHVIQWMPSLAGAITRAGEHPFYDALADVLAAAPHELGER